MTEAEQAVKQVLVAIVTVGESALLIGGILAAFYGWLWLLR